MLFRHSKLSGVNTSKTSAGILLYRRNRIIEVLLAHPGGPFWKNKDLGAWSIPKGEIDENEDPLNAAKREFEEETGKKLNGKFVELTPVIQKNGKKVIAWAVEQDIDVRSIKSNLIEIEWPPKSGKKQSIPEIDKVEWFTLSEAKEKIIAAQAGFIEELISKIN
jgi:predicted NUDIX family NTP pyrophosphohydrolase